VSCDSFAEDAAALRRGAMPLDNPLKSHDLSGAPREFALQHRSGSGAGKSSSAAKIRRDSQCAGLGPFAGRRAAMPAREARIAHPGTNRAVTSSFSDTGEESLPNTVGRYGKHGQASRASPAGLLRRGSGAALLWRECRVAFWKRVPTFVHHEPDMRPGGGVKPRMAGGQVKYSVVMMVRVRKTRPKSTILASKRLTAGLPSFKLAMST